ncbi:MAG: D-Ala-D-Ala carboxypeptidase family metallohydrolase [Desulfovibrio sp.]
MKQIPLSKNFTLAEFTRSETAARAGRVIVVPSNVQLNLKRLCVTVLQPLRYALGPISVSSGYRPHWLNVKIGGAANSAHLYGLAADISSPKYSALQVAKWLAESGVPFDQIIHEFGRWVHVSIARKNTIPRYELLTAMKVKGRTVYKTGLLPIAA